MFANKYLNQAIRDSCTYRLKFFDAFDEVFSYVKFSISTASSKTTGFRNLWTASCSSGVVCDSRPSWIFTITFSKSGLFIIGASLASWGKVEWNSMIERLEKSRINPSKEERFGLKFFFQYHRFSAPSKTFIHKILISLCACVIYSVNPKTTHFNDNDNADVALRETPYDSNQQWSQFKWLRTGHRMSDCQRLQLTYFIIFNIL